MKILFLNNIIAGGGAERITLNLADHLVKSGNCVSIITMEDDSQRAYKIPEGVTYRALGAWKIGRTPIETIWNTFKGAWHARKAIRNEGADIIIGMTSMAALILSAIRPHGVLSIGSMRGFPGESTHWWNHLARRLLYPRLDIITVQTETGRNWLQRNIHPRRVVVIPNSIELPLARQAPELPVSEHLPPGQRILLGAGRLVSVKAFDRLISAFAQLAPQHPDWTLAIAGEGADRPALEQQITDLGLSGRVVLPGRAGNLADWYRAADIFALTSHNEGFPNVLVEALAHGCPAVSVDCDTGPRDIIRHGENGLLVPQDDPDALVAALDRLMSDEDLRKRLAARAPEVLETFSPERVFAMWHKLFDTAPRRGRA